MANITAQMVKELRETTGAGMLDCKKALQEAEANMEKAIDILREKGLAKAAKKAFLQSSIPAPVVSLNSLTICAVMLAIIVPPIYSKW